MGGGTYGEGVVEGQDGDGDRQKIRWEYTVSNIILGTEHNDPLAYAPVLKLCHPIMSILGGHKYWLERER